MSVTVGTIREFIKDMDDTVELRSVNGSGGLSSIKHIHITVYKDGSGKPMLTLCPMGNHPAEYITLVKGTH